MMMFVSSASFHSIRGCNNSYRQRSHRPTVKLHHPHLSPRTTQRSPPPPHHQYFRHRPRRPQSHRRRSHHRRPTHRRPWPRSQPPRSPGPTARPHVATPGACRHHTAAATGYASGHRNAHLPRAKRRHRPR